MKKKRILFITNIPVPYRIDFYNDLGKYVDLTVIFEAKGASNQGIKFNWNLDEISNFKAIFLSEGDIEEKKINWKIFRYLKKMEYDEIIATNYSYYTEMFALIYMKMFRIAYYMETDGGLIREEHILKKLYKTFLVSGAKGYFSPSSSSDNYLIHYGAKKERIYRYPFTSLKENQILKKVLPLEEKSFYKNKLGISEEKVILAVGQFIPRKGFDLLIKASEGLNHKVGIYIVGGEPTDEYIQLRHSFNANHVHFVGFKTNRELEEYFKAADIFVLPTREDIWGLVINEAMAYGLPIISTDRCISAIELIENSINGYIINVESVEQLRDRIEELIFDESLRLKMAENGIEKIKKYTIEQMVNSHRAIFENSLTEENCEYD